MLAGALKSDLDILNNLMKPGFIKIFEVFLPSFSMLGLDEGRAGKRQRRKTDLRKLRQLRKSY
jgi:hypothetical protein